MVLNNKHAKNFNDQRLFRDLGRKDIGDPEKLDAFEALGPSGRLAH